MSVLEKLTEGIVDRDLQKEGAALLNKWEATGLLEGIESDSKRSGMARLLENQAKQLLKEASSMSAGDVEGFAAVAFPIVRRVFGGLVANDLVSVQPMSLPSGLIFFLDFRYSGQTASRFGLAEQSVYGGGVVGSELTGGVSDITEAGGGFYNLVNPYSSPTGSFTLLDAVTDANPSTMTAGEINDGTMATNGPALVSTGVEIESLSAEQKSQIRHDPDILANTDPWLQQMSCVVAKLTQAQMDRINLSMLGSLELVEADGTAVFGATTDDGANTDLVQVRRLTHLGYTDSTGATIVKNNGVSSAVTNDATNANFISFYFRHGSGVTPDFSDTDAQQVTLRFAERDAFSQAGAVGAVVGADNWGLEEAGVSAATSPTGASTSTLKNQIPEIDIKVDSVSVTAVTKKLKAKWSPELGQDLNAYHNLDAEVELTGILSEHIALEIDREILNDLIQGATAGTYYWSRSPGLFVNRVTGAEIGASSAAPDFTGTVSEWYETLVETINDVSAQIHRKTLRGGANFIVVSPEVANVLEFTAGFRASVTADDDRGTVGAVKVGALSKKWDVYVDPYFPRNLCLVGRNGGSFLETGYVYAPYVPLQVTPTIFGTEDFVPRKGVMTRYAKKMVRPDMYGLVVVRGLLGEAGATS